MQVNLTPFNNGRDFFQWAGKGINICDEKGIIKVSERNETVSIPTKLFQIFEYKEMYTGNMIIVSDDGEAAIAVQSIPSREDIDMPFYRIDVFFRDRSKCPIFTSITVCGDKNKDRFVQDFSDGYKSLIDND